MAISFFARFKYSFSQTRQLDLSALDFFPVQVGGEFCAIRFPLVLRERSEFGVAIATNEIATRKTAQQVWYGEG